MTSETSVTSSAFDGAELSERAETRWGETQPDIVSPASCAALLASLGTVRRDTVETRWGDWYPASVSPATSA